MRMSRTQDAASAEIVLIHDHDTTRDEFAPIIDRLLENGLFFRLPQR
jgi:hypothetical protein